MELIIIMYNKTLYIFLQDAYTYNYKDKIIFNSSFYCNYVFFIVDIIGRKVGCVIIISSRGVEKQISRRWMSSVNNHMKTNC